MPKIIDLTNQRFGRLIALERVANNKNRVMWKCQCDCGNIINVRGDYLRTGHTQSCGCKKLEITANTGKNTIKNYVGKRFGYLTVIEDSGKRETNGSVSWKCQCDCGNIIYVATSNLPRYISCGCIKSKGEKKIISLLIKMQIPFITQKQFETCLSPETGRPLRFDFYLPEQHILIEYDGEQHFHEIRNNRYGYEGIVARDNYKNQWCKENNIPLIRIPYTEYNNIDDNYMRAIIERNGWTEVK